MDETAKRIHPRNTPTLMKRTFYPLMLIVVILLFCRATGAAIGVAQERKLVKDMAGREVWIPENPQRIACLYASTAHMLALLGETEKIVATVDGVRRDVVMRMLRPELENVSVPMKSAAINIEELIRENIDLALIRRSTAENPGEAEKLDKAGIPYVVVDYASMDELIAAIRLLGVVFEKQEKAEAYIRFSLDLMDDLDRRFADMDESEKKTVYHSVNEATRTDPPGDIAHEITSAARLINVSAGGGLDEDAEAKAYATLEQIYVWDADYIIANDYHVTDYILSEPKWSGLSAVKNRRVFTLPIGLTRWAHPGSMEPFIAAFFLARQFYPDRFVDVHLQSFVHDYYKKFFDLDLNDDQMRQILSGVGMRLDK